MRGRPDRADVIAIAVALVAPCRSDDTQSLGEFEVGDASVGHSTHSHQFIPVWQLDCTLVNWCKCGEKRSGGQKELQESLLSCIKLKDEYLLERNKSSSKARQQEFVRAVEIKDKQIAWLECQIFTRSHSFESSTSTSEYLALEEIRCDGGTQSRAAIDLKHVNALGQQMEDGKELDPVTIFYDGSSYWLADGYHRWHAHFNRGKEVIACVIHSGSRRDAVLYLNAARMLPL